MKSARAFSIAESSKNGGILDFSVLEQNREYLRRIVVHIENTNIREILAFQR